MSNPTTAYNRWVIDPEHTQVHFSVQHERIATVRGSILSFTGLLEGTPQDLAAARIEMRFFTQSVDTQDYERDRQLRKAAFFDAARFPEIVFRSQSVAWADDETLRVSGTLHVKGRETPLEFNVEYGGLLEADFDGLPRMGFSVDVRLDRFALGFDFDERMPDGSPQIDAEVRVEIDLELTPETPNEA